MAQYTLVIPFIKTSEGGKSDNPKDKAAANPCPYPFRDGKKYHTVDGWTWTIWSNIFGNDQASANRFYAMDPDDWALCFKKIFWDALLGDEIISQPIANVAANWIFMSGQHNPEIDIQKILVDVFREHLTEDGVFGTGTITNLNAAPQGPLYIDICERCKQYYRDIVTNAQARGDHSQDGFLQGWLNRVDNLIKYNETFK